MINEVPIGPIIHKPQDRWEPTIKQQAFLELPYDVLEGFYAGAVGAGKSDVLLLYPIIHQLHTNPNFKGLFLRRTFPELKNEIIPRSREFFEILDATYNKQDKVWTFPSGALFFFGHCENEEDVHNYDSMQPNYVAFDELTSFTEWQYLYITLQRVRTKVGSGLPAIVRSASNPGNIGHEWVRKRFIDAHPEGFRILANKVGLKRIYIPATIDDNPHIDPNYRKSLESLPEAEKQAKLYGNWAAYEGSVFDEFRDKRYPDEPEHALHVIDDFEIPSWWPRIISMDWGYAPPAMTYVQYGAISPDKRIIVYREQAWQKTKIAEWAPLVREYIQKENPRVVKLCKSAGQDRGQEHTIQSEIEKELGKSVELTTNTPGSRVAGKMLVHEYLRWKPKPKIQKELEPYSDERASWILRNRGTNEYKDYMRTFEIEADEMNLPKILIFKSCKLLLSALRACVYDKTHPQDVAEFPGDDPYDAVRYLVDEADKYFKTSIDAQNEVKVNQEIERLRSIDMTAFYRQAKANEVLNRNKMQPVRRFHKKLRSYVSSH